MRNYDTESCKHCTNNTPHCTWCGNVINEDERALSYIRTRETLHLGRCLAEYTNEYDTAWYQGRD